MPKLTIELTQEEMEALTKLAQQERRTPAMQAAYLVFLECGTAPTWPTDTGLFSHPQDEGEI